MGKKNFIEACREHTNYTVATSRATFNLFCEILGYPKSEVHHFIGDDPHGVVDFQDGLYDFSMTDIHVVVSEYEHWLEIYKTNEELRKAVDAWYYYCQEWYEQHSYEEPRWVSVEERLPEGGLHVLTYDENNDSFVGGCRIDGLWYYNVDMETAKHEPTHWKKIITPEQEAERSKGCPNLRSWLAGCPVEGLRKPSLRWIDENLKAQEAAHQRVEEAKQALEDAIKEEVKLNKF